MSIRPLRAAFAGVGKGIEWVNTACIIVLITGFVAAPVLFGLMIVVGAILKGQYPLYYELFEIYMDGLFYSSALHFVGVAYVVAIVTFIVTTIYIYATDVARKHLGRSVV